MKTKKMTPKTVAPVKRETAATVSRNGNAHCGADLFEIAPLFDGSNIMDHTFWWPFAGDDAE